MRKKFKIWMLRSCVTGILAMALLLIFAGQSVRVALYALYFLDGFTRLEQGSRLASLLAYPVEKTQKEILLKNGQLLRLDLYRPAQKGLWPGVLIVPGFTKQGLEDPRMAGLARLMAGVGVVVVMPSLEMLFAYQWNADLLPQIEAAFDYLAKQPEVQPDRLGLFGISISGGFALAAAGQTSIAKQLDFTIAFAPFYDFKNLYEFSLTGQFQIQAKIFQKKPNPFSRWIFLYNVLPALLDPNTADFQSIQNFLRLNILEEPKQAKEHLKKLSPASQQLLQLLTQGSPEELQPFLQKAVEYRQIQAKQLSPSESLCNLQGDLFILHGQDDDVIAFSESLNLQEHCLRCPHLRCDLLLTGLYDHADIETEAHGLYHALQTRIPEYAKYYAFVARVVSKLLP